MALVQIQETPRWKRLLGFVGPGFLVSVAYLDPGNLQTDLQAGADHKYELLWIVLLGLIFALIIQSRSANLGIVTGKHLAEHCRAEYPASVSYCLWILAEIAVIAADIPEVMGTAFALNLLFKIHLWTGVLLAGLHTLLLLGLQRYGIRKLEIVIITLTMICGGCFFAVLIHVKASPKEILTGMFVPKLSGKGATLDAISLLGALIMPHNLFLHSALVISRKFPHSPDGIESASTNFLIESGLALFLAFLINVAVVSLTGGVCSDPKISLGNKAYCKDVTLNSASSLFKNVLGDWSSKLYAISLLASGQSSIVTGTYAGQYIMQGFLDLKMKLWLRNLVTRSIAVVPSVAACIMGGSRGAAKLIIVASMILSFELPFALVPLLRFTSSEVKMGHHKNSIQVSLVTWLLVFCSIGINIYFLGSTLIGLMMSNQMPKDGSIFAGILACLMVTLYLALLAYLSLKRERPNASPPHLAMATIPTGGSRDERGSDLRSNQKPNEFESDDIIPG